MDSIHNEGKPVAAKRFIRTFKAKIYKCMISISKTVYISKLDDIVNQHNNKYHRTIKMKPVDVKDNTYIGSIKEVNDKGPKLKFGDHVRISIHRNISLKDSLHIGLKKFLLLKKLKIQFHMLLMISMAKKLLEHFIKKNYKRLINKNLG